MPTMDMCNFQIFIGKEDNTAEVGLSQRVVCDLLKPYVNSGHRLFTDNVCSSPQLSTHLLILRNTHMRHSPAKPDNY